MDFLRVKSLKKCTATAGRPQKKMGWILEAARLSSVSNQGIDNDEHETDRKDNEEKDNKDTSRAGQAGGGSFKETTISQRKNLPIECA